MFIEYVNDEIIDINNKYVNDNIINVYNRDYCKLNLNKQ